jgi:acyl carrier protein
VNTENEVVALLGEVLNLGDRAGHFTRDTALLGAIPELDSMAVAALMTAMEERFGFAIADDDIDGATFASVGSLVDFVQARL